RSQLSLDIPSSGVGSSPIPPPRGTAATPLQRIDDSSPTQLPLVPIEREVPFAPPRAVVDAVPTVAAPQLAQPTRPTSVQRLIAERATTPMQIAVPSPAAGLPIPRSHSAPSATTRPEAHDVPSATAIPATVQRDVLVQPAVLLPAPRMSLASDAGSA